MTTTDAAEVMDCDAAYEYGGSSFRCQRPLSPRGQSYAHKFHRYEETIGQGAKLVMEWAAVRDRRWDKEKVISNLEAR